MNRKKKQEMLDAVFYRKCAEYERGRDLLGFYTRFYQEFDWNMRQIHGIKQKEFVEMKKTAESLLAQLKEYAENHPRPYREYA